MLIKSISLTSAIVVVIIGVIALTPGHHRTVPVVHAASGTNPAVVVLRANAGPGAHDACTVLSWDEWNIRVENALGGFSPPYTCAVLITVIEFYGLVREDFGVVDIEKGTGDIQSYTWVFTGPPVCAGACGG